MKNKKPAQKKVKRAKHFLKQRLGEKDFEAMYKVFEFYWKFLDTHPTCTYEDAEIARLQACKDDPYDKPETIGDNLE